MYKLKKIDMINFGSSIDTSIDFTDKNLFAIVGENGAGKSTILKALYFGIFGTLHYKNLNLGNLINNENEGEPAKVVLEFEKDKNGEQIIYKIDRVIKKDSGSSRKLIIETREKQEKFTTDTEIKEKLKDGFNKNTFLCSNILTQGDVDRIVNLEKGDIEGIVNLTYDSEKIDNYIEIIKNKYKEIEDRVKIYTEIKRGLLRDCNKELEKTEDLDSKLKTVILEMNSFLSEFKEEAYQNSENIKKVSKDLDEIKEKIVTGKQQESIIENTGKFEKKIEELREKLGEKNILINNLYIHYEEYRSSKMDLESSDKESKEITKQLEELSLLQLSEIKNQEKNESEYRELLQKKEETDNLKKIKEGQKYIKEILEQQKINNLEEIFESKSSDEKLLESTGKNNSELSNNLELLEKEIEREERKQEKLKYMFSLHSVTEHIEREKIKKCPICSNEIKHLNKPEEVENNEKILKNLAKKKNEIEKQIVLNNAEIKNLEKNIIDKNKQIEIKSKSEALFKQNIESKLQEMDIHSVDEVLKIKTDKIDLKIEDKLKKNIESIENVKTRIVKMNTDIAVKTEQKRLTNFKIETFEKEFSTKERELNDILSKYNLQIKEFISFKKIDEFDKLRDKIADFEEKLKLENSKKDPNYFIGDIFIFEEDKVQLENKLELLLKEKRRLESTKEQYEKIITRYEEINEELKGMEKERTLLRIIKEEFSSDNFPRWIKEWKFQELLDHANDKLKDFLNGRYRLFCDKDFNLFVEDFEIGGKFRNANLLSGAEKIIVSLTIAFVLSELYSDANFFFVDEGFSALHKDNLMIIYETLEHFSSKTGKLIGIITHDEGFAGNFNEILRVRKNCQVSWESR